MRECVENICQVKIISVLINRLLLTVFYFTLHFQKKEYNKYIQKKICITHKTCDVKNKK